MRLEEVSSQLVMPSLPIYMDHHSTTPTDPRVVDAMLPFFSKHFGNAASRHHSFGWSARDAVKTSRRQVAELIGADPREVLFTSGATESNNLAIKGVVAACPHRQFHAITMSTEHHSVIDSCRRLERDGISVTYLNPKSDGLLDLSGLERSLRPDTRLVTVMLANNEIGVLQPIADIARLTRGHGIVLHCDAAQAVGKVPVDVGALEVDLLSLTAHKIYGPKGIGALYIRRCRPKIQLEPMVDGGGHEQGYRSGTLNVPGVVGFGAASKLCLDRMPSEMIETRALRDRLLAGLTKRLDGVTVNGSMAQRLPHNLNLSFAHIEGESLLLGIDDIAVSSGAACTTANPEPSHVLTAIGVPDRLATASIRFGLGRSTTEADVDYVVNKISSLVERLRGTSRNHS